MIFRGYNLHDVIVIMICAIYYACNKNTANCHIERYHSYLEFVTKIMIQITRERYISTMIITEHSQIMAQLMVK